MTLSQAVRVPFSRAIANLRADWDVAGVEAAMVELSQQIPDPSECLALMVAWARRGAARTPAGVLQPTVRTAPAPAPATTAAHQSSGWTDTAWCDDHEVKAKLRPDGTKSCCWSGDADPEPYRRTGTSGPPDEVRARIAASVGPGREGAK